MEDSIRIRTYDGQYRIIGGDFQSMLSLVRGLPKRRYQPSERIWEIPQNVTDLQEKVEEAGFHVTADTEMGRPLERSVPRRKGGADRILVRVQDGLMAVVGGGFREMLEVVKAIEGRRFLSSEKLWELPGGSRELAKQVEEAGFRLVTPQEADALPPPENASEAGPARERAPRAESNDRIRVRAQDGEFWVTGLPFRDMLDALKAIEGRRFQPDDKLWEIPLTAEALAARIAVDGLAMAPAAEEGSARAPGQSQREAPDEDMDMPPWPPDMGPPPDEDEDDFGF